MAVKATATENRNDGAARPRVEDESSGLFQSLMYLGAIIVPLASQVVFLDANKISHPAWWNVLTLVVITIALHILRIYICVCDHVHCYGRYWRLKDRRREVFRLWVAIVMAVLTIAGSITAIILHLTKAPCQESTTTSPWKKKVGIAMAEVAQFLNIWGQGKAINRMREKEDHTPSVITLEFLVAIAVILLHPTLKHVKIIVMAAMLFTLSVKVALVIDGDKDSHGYTPIAVSTGFAVDYVLARVYVYVARYKPEWRRCQEASELEDFHLRVLLCTGLVSAGCAIIGIQEH